MINKPATKLMQEYTRPIILGLTEPTTIIGKKRRRIRSRIDTGATMSSIDSKLAQDLGITEPLRYKRVKNANGITQRPVVELSIKIKDKEYTTEATIADRSNLNYNVLIGQNTLKLGPFLIDPHIK